MSLTLSDLQSLVVFPPLNKTLWGNMKLCDIRINNNGTLENPLEIERRNLFYFSEKICSDKKCRYPQLALRILIHVIASVGTDGKIYICARRLSQAMDVHYDTVTKCIKYLREIDVLRKDIG
jgi:hypothetical protein